MAAKMTPEEVAVARDIMKATGERTKREDKLVDRYLREVFTDVGKSESDRDKGKAEK